MRVAILPGDPSHDERFGGCRRDQRHQPDHAQTFAYGEMIWHQLYLERTGGELVARITFSNLLYVSGDGPRRDEPFDFRFPGFIYIYVYPYTNHFRVRAHYRHLGFATLKR
jgi:hypothetical protein